MYKLTKESYSGRLHYKSSGFRGQWKYRYFQLRGNILFHYENQKDEIAANMTFLEGIEVEKEEVQEVKLKHGQFPFTISYGNKSLFISIEFFMGFKKLMISILLLVKNKNVRNG